MPNLRFGILGAARIASALAPAIRAASNAELIGVAARDETRAAAFADRFEIPRVFASYNELLSSDEIDAVYIPLPNDLHAPWAINALEAGKHVLLEKPSAMTSAEAERILEVAAKHGKTVFESFMYRYHPQFTRALEVVRGGEIGELRLVRSSFSFSMTNQDDFRWLRSKGGGGLFDLGCYCTNAALLFMNDTPRSVDARATWGSKSGAPKAEFVDLEFAATLEFNDGKRALFDCSLQHPFRQQLELVGTEGIVELESFVSPREQPARITINGKPEEAPAADRYQLMVEHFARVVAGLEAPRFDAPDQPTSLLPQMRVLEALLQSAERNTPR
jgi:D-xylose 1-dehydrogenase (NADP+, D-xylono-1,5-lactone-forming)